MNKHYTFFLKVNLMTLLMICSMAAISQTYLYQDFESAFTGTIPAPAGNASTIPANAAGNWTQTRLLLGGDGTPMTVGSSGQKDWTQNTWTGSAWNVVASATSQPGAPIGTGVLFLEDRNFGSAAYYGARRVETPAIDLSTSTSPYVRFRFAAPNTNRNGYNVRVVAYNPAESPAIWRPIMILTVNGNSNWDSIAVKVPDAFKANNVKFGMELTGAWGSNHVYVDEFKIMEFTPPTATAVATGTWNTAATWDIGRVPTSEYNVVVNAGVTLTNNIAGRCQNMTVNGIVQGSTTATDPVHIFGDLIVNAGGVYRSFNGTNGRVTMLGGSINNAGTVDFVSYSTSGGNMLPSTTPSASSSVLFLCGGGPATIGGAGTYTARTAGTCQFYNVWVANSSGVTFNVPITVSRVFGLYYGAVNPNGNLTLGESAVTTAQPIERSKGSFTTAPTWGAGVNHTVTYKGAAGGSGTTYSFLSCVKENIITGEEIPTVAGVKRIQGSLILNTFDNVTLGAPVYIGTPSASATLTFTQGILNTSATNILIFDAGFSGISSAHANPSITTVSSTSFPSNQGSFINGPVRVITPVTGTGARLISLGVGNDLLPNTFTGVIGTPPNYVINNLPKPIQIDPGGTNWGGADFTISIDAAPSGSLAAAPSPVLNAIMGNRSYKLVYNGATPVPATTKITAIRAHVNMTDGGATLSASAADGLVGNIADLRLAEAPSLTGPWSNRNGSSASTGTGTTGSPIFASTATTTLDASASTATSYFAWGSVGFPTNIGATALVTPTSSQSCYTATEVVTVRVRNLGLNTINFATNNLTVNCNVSNAVTASLSATVTTGTLAPGATLDVPMTATLNMTTNGTYTFNASTTMTGDANAADDAITAVNIVRGTPVAFSPIASGNWSNTAIWCGGNIPTAADSVVVPSGITLTANSTGLQCRGLTIATGGTLTIASGADVLIGATRNDRRLLVNGTFTMTGGTLTLNGSMAVASTGTFNQSAGNIIVDGNGGATGATNGSNVASGTSLILFSSGSGSVTGGTITIVDPHYVNTTSSKSLDYNVSSTPMAWGPAHTLRLGDGVSTEASLNTNGFIIEQYTGTGKLNLGNLWISGGSGTNRWASLGAWSTFVGNKLTVDAGSELRINSSSTNAVFSGDIENNGIITSTVGVSLAGTSGNSTVTNTVPQTIGGSGVYRNLTASPTANFTNLLINSTLNTGRVTLNVPVSVSGTLTITAGRVFTSNTNLLTLGTGTSSTGTLTFTDGMVVGPFKRWIGTTATSYTFPMGNGESKKGAVINFTGAPTAGGTLTANWNSTPADFPNAAPLTEGALTVNSLAPIGYWQVDAADGLTGGTYTGTFTSNNSAVATSDYTKLVLVKRPSAGGNWILDGTHVTTTGSNNDPVLSRTGMSGFSQFAIGGDQTILPITLNYFRGVKTTTGNALNWKVTCTSARISMEVERSADARKFSSIGRIEADQARCGQPFDLVDVNPIKGVNYYRLKMIDVDGKVSYSAVIAIINASNGIEFVGMYPTVVRSNAQLSISAAKSGKVQTIITDMSGKLIQSSSHQVPDGSSLITVDCSKLASGVYNITGVVDGARTKTIRFVVSH